MPFYNYDKEQIGVNPNSLTERDYYCSFSLFEKIGVCGDSYANGYCGESPQAESGVNHPNISWPKQLERRSGATVFNYSTGGQSARSFKTNSTVGLLKLITQDKCGLYILALERNDYNIALNDDTYLGSLTDITSGSLGSYPDTFYGNYATIIETIKQYSPESRLVMMIGDYPSSNTLGTAFNNAMKEIADHYEIPYMEQLSDDYFLPSNAYYREKSAGGHPAPYAYSGMELAIERLFNKCVLTYKNYFMYYVGIPVST